MKQSIVKTAVSFLFVVFIISATAGCSTLAMLLPQTETATLIPTITQTKTPAAIFTPLPTATPQSTSTPTQAPVPTSSIQDPSAQDLTTECRRVVDGLYDLKANLELPDSLFEETPQRSDFGFDANSYFSVLTHLMMSPGYALDYLYFADDLGGLPLVYARKTNDQPFLTYEEFLQAYNEELSDERSYGSLGHSYDYLAQVQIDQTPESYFEFVMLATLGDQFYLFWHGLYNDTKIFCDASDFESVKPEFEEFDMELPQEILEQMEDVDFTPKVLVEDTTVTVRFVSFTKWGGFYENVYVMDREDPYNLIDAQSYPLIEYEIQVAF